jgi:hypothetical protein
VHDTIVELGERFRGVERIAKVANGITMSRAKRRSRKSDRERPSAIVGARKSEMATRVAHGSGDDRWLRGAKDEHRKWYVGVVARSAIKNKLLASNRRTCGGTYESASDLSCDDRLG